MVFSSDIFLFFFLPLVLTFYLLINKTTLRNFFLVIASLIFYAWGEGEIVLLMLVSIALNYLFGIKIARATTHAKYILIISIVANLGILAVFKYGNFIVANINIVLKFFDIPLLNQTKIHLPIGISFFTFQAISYLMDVYRKQGPVQESFINLALYISLFPQLIAGPIVRYKDVATQILKRFVTIEDFFAGIKRFIIGLAKKVLIANTMALVVDDIFSRSPEQLSFSLAWLGVLCYALQIYFDFSGYSDMAIGLGKMFGFHFPENFYYPYIAQSIREFWRRWHISLSSWFRDYLYIPLGGSKYSAARTYFNLFVVFFLCGLWHGASWNFVVWGFYYGFFLVVERLLGNRYERLWRPLKHIYTLLIVLFGWVLFRSSSLSYAIDFMLLLLGKNFALASAIDLDLNTQIAIVFGIIGATPILPWWENYCKKFTISVQITIEFFTMLILFNLLLACAMTLASGVYNPFIYFRF